MLPAHGCAAALLLRRAGDAQARVAGPVAALTTGLGLVALLGYASGLETTYGWGHLTRMAVHTSVGFIALGAGLVLHCSNVLRRIDPGGMWSVVLAGVGSLTVPSFSGRAWQLTLDSAAPPLALSSS